MVPTGDLIVRNVDSSDEAHAFQCRTVRRLTGETTVSSPAKITISKGERKESNLSSNLCSIFLLFFLSYF